jgi:pimeloyl-ACP methyl ester carboxylesterase
MWDHSVTDPSRVGEKFAKHDVGLLLVHGFGAAKEDFTRVLPALAAEGWHAVAPDLRGHGASDKPSDEGDYSLEIMGRDLLGLLDALAWSRAVVLGHSAGGPVVQHLVALAPERVAALVLMDTWTGAFTGVDPSLIELAVSVAREAGMEALADAIDALDGGPLSTPAYEALLEREPDHAEFGRSKLVACSPAMYASMAQQLPKASDMSDVLGALRESGIPALVLVGEHDEPFLAPSACLADVLGVPCTVIPDGGHGPQFESPEAWFAELSAFLDRVAADAR